MSSEARKAEEGIARVFGRAAATYDRIGRFTHYGERLVERAQLAPGGYRSGRCGGAGRGNVSGCEWEDLWSTGFRRHFEQMTATVLERVRADLYQKLQALRRPDGIHAVYRALFACAAK